MRSNRTRNQTHASAAEAPRWAAAPVDKAVAPADMVPKGPWGPADAVLAAESADQLEAGTETVSALAAVFRAPAEAQVKRVVLTAVLGALAAPVAPTDLWVALAEFRVALTVRQDLAVAAAALRDLAVVPAAKPAATRSAEFREPAVVC